MGKNLFLGGAGGEKKTHFFYFMFLQGGSYIDFLRGFKVGNTILLRGNTQKVLLLNYFFQKKT